MPVSYKRLWVLAAEKGLKKMELRKLSGISTNALAKLGKNEHVSTEVLEKLCLSLDCKIEDIVQVVKEKEHIRKDDIAESVRYDVYNVSVSGVKNLEQAKEVVRNIYFVGEAGSEGIDEDALAEEFPEVKKMIEERKRKERDEGYRSYKKKFE